jgi:hypothetical protein
MMGLGGKVPPNENPSVRSGMAATADIPTIMLHVTKSVRDDFVESLARPGRNVTGLAGPADVPAKPMEMLRPGELPVRSSWHGFELVINPKTASAFGEPSGIPNPVPEPVYPS